MEDVDTWTEDDLDNIVFAPPADETAIGNKDGAGATMAAPDWWGLQLSCRVIVSVPCSRGSLPFECKGHNSTLVCYGGRCGDTCTCSRC